MRRVFTAVLLLTGTLCLADGQPPDPARQREIWNKAFSEKSYENPSEFLVAVSKDLKPGKALDVGMGQGRNAIFLAQQGWDVTGVDISDVAIDQANARARTLGVKITSVLQDAFAYDFGASKWDLIALVYVGVRPFVEHVRGALKPGGLVLVEGFHRESVPNSPQDNPVAFDTNELLKLFAGFRILRYEDVLGPLDYGRKPTGRVVRLLAQKP
ncbi:MAG: class I SAM-dependent methyltransferase [Acidobacteria bacterium]|nr:class I SAM-dependent methyltransferase [Acidobacteriota bacterium]